VAGAGPGPARLQLRLRSICRRPPSRDRHRRGDGCAGGRTCERNGHLRGNRSDRRQDARDRDPRRVLRDAAPSRLARRCARCGGERGGRGRDGRPERRAGAARAVRLLRHTPCRRSGGLRGSAAVPAAAGQVAARGAARACACARPSLAACARGGATAGGSARECAACAWACTRGGRRRGGRPAPRGGDAEPAPAAFGSSGRRPQARRPTGGGSLGERRCLARDGDVVERRAPADRANGTRGRAPRVGHGSASC
jgi:hypothetical protein